MFFILIGIILGMLIYYKIIKPTKYWKSKHVVYEPALPIVGNLGPSLLQQKHMMEITLDIYKKYPNERYVGFMQFTRPLLLLRDINLIKQIGVKDFEHFHDRFTFVDSDSDPFFSKSLVSLRGDDWKKMRATLSPAFTSTKMKNMYHLMSECAENFVGHFRGKEQVAVEMKEVISRFTTDVIASTAFGITIDSMEDPNNDFHKMGTQLSRFNVVVFLLKTAVSHISSKLAKLLPLKLFPESTTNYFRKIVKDNIAEREQNGIVRPDLIHLMMEARKGLLKYESSEEKVEGFATVEESLIGKNSQRMNLTHDDIVAQAMVFFLAGFDTVSTTFSFMAYELAVNFDVQKKLQEEIDSACKEHQGKIPYEALLSLKYLDQVVCETLRLWSPGYQLDRVCTKKFTITPQNPKEKTLVVEEGDMVLLPVMGIHRDSKYFSDPDRFDPERFSNENKAKILPGTYLPFGVGPRNCIGSRFALLEIKILFFHLLTKIDIVPINKTQIPLKISPKKRQLAPERGFNLGFRPRK